MVNNMSSTGIQEHTDAPEGCVFNIQRYTIHDGPGIRTEVFFKGCPLKCRWCGNPEGVSPYPEVGVYSSRCIAIDKCGYCITACPESGKGAFIREGNIISGINREACSGCLKCADACPSNALMIWGNKFTINSIMTTIMADMDFYKKSGGGVTVSGGEPLVQWEFVVELLKECQRNGISTCLESSLYVQPEVLERVYPFADIIITDIKHMDPSKHKEFTGVDNELILSNIVKTVESGKPLFIRIPVVPDHNNDEKNIKATARFIIDKLDNRVRQVQLLPYRQLGVEKYKSLGCGYPMDYLIPPERNTWEKNIRHLVELMVSNGINAVAGTTADWYSKFEERRGRSFK